MATENSDLGHSTLVSTMEFKAGDEAWYDVTMICDGSTLTVIYLNFSDEFKEVFDSSNFKSLQELGEFEKRFRTNSAQLQDQECKMVVKGNVVCASYFFNNDEIKFHDAIVDDVMNRNHSFAKGEEECLCSYRLVWLNGPLKGTKTFANIANICLTPSATTTIDPALASFLKISSERLRISTQNVGLSGGNDSAIRGYVGKEEIYSPTMLCKKINLEAFFMKLRRQRRSRCAVRTLAGRLEGSCKKRQTSYRFGYNK